MTRRLFIAVDLTAEIKARLRGVQALPEFEGLRVRWTPPEQTHLTLVFLGATDERAIAPIGQAICPAVAGLETFSLTLGGFGAFPDLARPKVIWCGVDGGKDQLERLRSAIVTALGAVVPQTDAGPFAPHLTIGRVRRDAQAAERRMVGSAVAHAETMPGAAWWVNQAVLYESVPFSNGVRHTPLLSAPLRGAIRV